MKIPDVLVSADILDNFDIMDAAIDEIHVVRGVLAGLDCADRRLRNACFDILSRTLERLEDAKERIETAVKMEVS